MSNSFSKEERVAFEQILEGFEDALVISRNISVYRTDDQSMERANDIIWRPMPFIAQSFTGTDMTSNFVDSTELSVPATLGYQKSSPWVMTAKELRDKLKEGRLGEAAQQKLASDVNVAVSNVAALEGTLFVKRSSTAAGFDDVALCEAIFNERGVAQMDRYLALSTRDYNGMASNLASRTPDNSKVLSAYERAYVGRIASFETYKLDYAYRKAAALGTTVTMNGADQYYTPAATSTAGTGETSNVDNRYQTISVTVSSGTIAVGDAFTIAGVNSVHMITKQDTGQLMTFRVKAIITGSGGTGTIQISPPIISAQGTTDAEYQYQNVTATPANGAAITWLNTVVNYVNPFWHKDAIELLPGRNAVPTDAGAAVMKATTDQGIEVVMQKQYDINTMKTKFRMDILFGVCMTNPAMAGVMMFSQT
jgi:P22 coat protein - gene protein 5